MSLAALCPIGQIAHYQATWRPCVESMAAGADRVYLLSSSRYNRFPVLPDNVHIISTVATWFARTPNGSEWFDAYKVMENVQYGLGLAHWAGFEQAVCLFCNWYVPEEAWKAIREPVEEWGWLYRKDYLAGQMFHTSTRLPFVVRTDRKVRFTADALEHDGKLVPWEKGCWPEQDGAAVVDLQLEIRLFDLAQRMTFIRCYHDLMPKRSRQFSWKFWRSYYRQRYGKKQKSDEAPPLDVTQPEFVSHEVLEALG